MALRYTVLRKWTGHITPEEEMLEESFSSGLRAPTRLMDGLLVFTQRQSGDGGIWLHEEEVFAFTRRGECRFSKERHNVRCRIERNGTYE